LLSPNAGFPPFLPPNCDLSLSRPTSSLSVRQPLKEEQAMTLSAITTPRVISTAARAAALSSKASALSPAFAPKAPNAIPFAPSSTQTLLCVVIPTQSTNKRFFHKFAKKIKICQKSFPPLTANPQFQRIAAKNRKVAKAKIKAQTNNKSEFAIESSVVRKLSNNQENYDNAFDL
jgi:hypothetical protein